VNPETAFLEQASKSLHAEALLEARDRDPGALPQHPQELLEGLLGAGHVVEQRHGDRTVEHRWPERLVVGVRQDEVGPGFFEPVPSLVEHAPREVEAHKGYRPALEDLHGKTRPTSEVEYDPASLRFEPP